MLTPPLSAEDHVDGPERAELELVVYGDFREDLIGYTVELGLDFDRVGAELDSGLASGVTGTPGFFVGGRLQVGSFDAASLTAALEASSS